MNLGSIFSNDWVSKIQILMTPFFNSIVSANWQTKALNGSVSITGVIPDITINNLVIGKTYRHNLTLFENNAGAGLVAADVFNGTTKISFINVASPGSNAYYNTSIIFVADNATVTVNVTANPRQITGDGTTSFTHVQIEELPNHVQVTSFS